MGNGRTHPEERDLLLYYDGELPARRAAGVRKHLEVCGECQARLEETESTLQVWVRFRREVLHTAVPPPPLPWKNLYREFEQAAAPAGPAVRFLNGLRRRARWLMGGAAVVCAAAFVYTVRPVPQAARTQPAVTAVS